LTQDHNVTDGQTDADAHRYHALRFQAWKNIVQLTPSATT